MKLTRVFGATEREGFESAAKKPVDDYDGRWRIARGTVELIGDTRIVEVRREQWLGGWFAED